MSMLAGTLLSQSSQPYFKYSKPDVWHRHLEFRSKDLRMLINYIDQQKKFIVTEKFQLYLFNLWSFLQKYYHFFNMRSSFTARSIWYRLPFL